MARPLTITTNGNAQVDTAEKISGTGSLLLDGTGDFLVVDNSNGEVNVDSGNWTVECWINPNDAVNDDYPVIESNVVDTNGLPSLDHRWYLVLQVEDDPNNRIRFETTGPTGTTTLSVTTILESSVVDDWHHLAIVYDGTNITLFYDGVERGSTTGTYYGLSTKEVDGATETPRNLNIGGNGVYNINAYYDGWIDEIRISNTARYTTTFTPESRFQPDSNTLLLIHMDGADGSTTFTDDVGVQGSADLTSSFAATATANPNPSIVDMNIVYTWDDLDVSWDYWHRSVDAWLIRDPLELSSQTIIEVSEITNAVLGSSDLTATFTVDTDGGIILDASSDLDTQFTIDTDGGIVKDAEANLADNFGFAISALAVRQDAPELSFSFALTSSADITRNAQANLSVLGFVISDARLSDVRGTAVLESTFALDVSADNFKNAAADLVSSVTVDAVGTRVAIGQCSLDSAFAVTVSADNIKSAASVLASQFTAEISADRLVNGQASLESACAVAAQAVLVVDAQCSITSDFALDASARNLKLADIYIEDFAALSAQAEVTANASAVLAAEFTSSQRAGLIIEPNEVFDYDWEYPDNWDSFPIDQWGVRGFVVFDNFALDVDGGFSPAGAVNLDVISTIEATAEIIRNASTSIQSQFEQTATAGVILDASAELSALGFLVTDGDSVPATLGSALLASEFRVDVSAQATLVGSANLESFGFVVSDSRISNVRASAELSSNFNLTVDIDLFRNASSDLASEFTVSPIPTLTLGASATLESLGFVVSDGRISDVRGSANLSSSFTAVFAGDLRLLQSDFTYRVLPELRSIGRPLVNYRSPRTITPLGNITISSAQAKFGISSALISNIGDLFSVSGVSDLYNSDFTAEMWIWNSNLSQLPNGVLWDIRTSASSGLYVYVSYGSIGLYEGITGKGLTSAGFVNSQWNHIAIVRNSNNVKIFVNGVQKISATVTTTNYSSRTTYVGGTYNNSIPLRGYIDEVRLSNTARYTTAFTAPISPFSNDQYVRALVHFDGGFEDDVLIRSTTPTDTQIIRETNTYAVIPENRRYTVDQERRDIDILRETRILEVDY